LLKLVPLLLFLVVGVANYSLWTHAPATAPSMQGLGRAIILGFFTFTGMETALIASGEVERPGRTIPLALGIAMGAVTLLYLGIQVVAQGMLGAGLANSAAPLADAMARVHPGLQAVMLVAAAVSMFAWLGSDLLGTPRMLLAFARDGVLPRALGRVHPRTHAPYIAIICYTLIAAALVLTGTFAELAVLSALATATLYLASAAALWVLVRREAVARVAPPASAWLQGAAVFGIAFMLAMIALGSWAELAGLAVMLALSALVYGQRFVRFRAAPVR
jgi:amino acid transporter